MWRRESGTLHGIYEGDGSVVNVIEGHPTLPLLAVSGIDHQPKVSPSLQSRVLLPETHAMTQLFSPRKGEDEWSRLDRAEGIVSNNMGSVVVPPILSLLQELVNARGGGSADPSQCTHQ